MNRPVTLQLMDKFMCRLEAIDFPPPVSTWNSTRKTKEFDGGKKIDNFSMEIQLWANEISSTRRRSRNPIITDDGTTKLFLRRNANLTIAFVMALS